MTLLEETARNGAAPAAAVSSSGVSVPPPTPGGPVSVNPRVAPLDLSGGVPQPTVKQISSGEATVGENGTRQRPPGGGATDGRCRRPPTLLSERNAAMAEKVVNLFDLVGEPANQRLLQRDQKLLVRLSELHVLLDEATEELRDALIQRNPSLAGSASRRLYSIGVLFGEAARWHGDL